MRVNHFACVIALLLVHQHHTWAQRASNPTPSAEVATAGERADDSLVDFEGVYDYQQGSTIAIVAAGSKLFAVLDEARYPLRRTGPDQFVNAPGDTIPFRRSADGRVSGFVERGVFYARRTSSIRSRWPSHVRFPDRWAAMGSRGRTYTSPRPISRMDLRSAQSPRPGWTAGA
jgi:hypothetical protein